MHREVTSYLHNKSKQSTQTQKEENSNRIINLRYPTRYMYFGHN